MPTLGCLCDDKGMDKDALDLGSMLNVPVTGLPKPCS